MHIKQLSDTLSAEFPVLPLLLAGRTLCPNAPLYQLEETKMEEGYLVYSFQKNPEEEIRFSLREYKDRRYLDLRLWFQPSNGGDYRPTKKGLTLSVEHLPELKKGLERAAKAAVEMPLHETSKSIK